MTLAVRKDEEQEEDSGLDENEQPAEHQYPTETQIKMVNQYHRNLGHPSSREFLKVLKAAHAKPPVREYVRREYRCADCDAHAKPQPSRKAAIPRTYEFNRITALDVFYIPLRGQSLPILNICHDTNFQIAALMRQDGTPTAAMVWSTFQRSWRRYFGTPDVMITDGGPEFRGDFAQSGKYAGILEVIVDADAPWQNGKCERHGGLVKDLLAKGLETEVVFTPDDLEDLLAEIVSVKNRRGNRGGFTPYHSFLARIQEFQRVVIYDAVDEVGMQELSRAMPTSTTSKSVQAKHEHQGPRSHADGDPHGEGAAAISGQGSTASRSKLSPWAMGVCVAKRIAWSKRSNRRSIAFSVGRSRTCCSTRWHHGLGVNERMTLEVCARANS